MRITCPACGSQSPASAEKRDGYVTCIGCGKRIHWAVEADDALRLVKIEDDIGFEMPVIAQSVKPVRRSTGAPDPRLMLLVVIAAVLTGALIVVLAVVVGKATLPAASPEAVSAPNTPATEPAWDRAHRTDLLAMKDRAESMAIAGQWKEAYDTYRQIISDAADHDIADPVVVQVVAGARIGEDRVLARLMPASQPAVPMSAGAWGVFPTTAPGFASATTEASADRLSAAPLIAPVTQPTTYPLVQLDPAELTADNAPPLGGPNPPPLNLHAYTLPDTVTDAAIGAAITRGVAFLKGQFHNGEVTTQIPVPIPVIPQVQVQQKPRPTNLDHPSDLGDLPPPATPIVPGPALSAPWESAYSLPGADALCVYALLHAGQAMDQKILGPQDPFTDQILTVLKQYNMVFTYHRSLRAAALSVFARVQDNPSLEEDVRWLLLAGKNGSYTYTIPTADNDGQWDNSNSQYGLLGVWSGAMAGFSIPRNYWAGVEQHWNSCANPDGTFGYTMGTSSTTMTCAGVASLMVARDYLDTSDITAKDGDRPSLSPAIDNALSWLDAGDNCLSDWNNMAGAGYALYGLERVGLASGFKFFGAHDWYSELARRLVNEQHLDGSWGSNPPVNGALSPQTLVDTAYALLFLSRGRHPVLYNKLRYEGDWNNRAHDVSHLARWASHELERPLNWQVVNLRRNWFDWMDAPVLYIAGDKKPNLSPQDYASLRAFADGGGLIFTHADGGSPEFTRWVVQLCRTIFPNYVLMQVPREHAVYSTVYNLKDPPPLLSISNGSRLLLIHSPTDLAGGWQLDWSDEKKSAFQLGVNLFVYAAGKGNLKNRLVSSFIPADPDRPDGTRQIARLQYAGEWDPEPYAWARFRRYFQWETHQAVEPITVQLKDLTPNLTPLAALTGTVRHDFTPAEQQAAKGYVQAGGILLIDACGGQEDFVKCIETSLLPQAFAGILPQPISASHPLLLASRAHADDLTHFRLRGFAIENSGKKSPIESIPFGKGWVIFSRLDLTTGLLGTQSWGIRGFDPAYAQALVKNAVLWAESALAGYRKPMIR